MITLSYAGSINYQMGRMIASRVAQILVHLPDGEKAAVTTMKDLIAVYSSAPKETVHTLEDLCERVGV